MKRVLVLTPSYSIGGTNSSLLSFLSYAKGGDLHIDVFCRLHCGKLKEEIEQYSVLEENVWLSQRIIEGNFLKKGVNFLLRLIRKMLLPFGIEMEIIYTKIGGKTIASNNYDAVVSYQEDLSSILSYYPAKKRIAWVRCEYSRYMQIHNNPNESKYFNRIENVVCVSEFAKRSFVHYYPNYEKKVKVINNFLDVEQICEKANMNVSFDAQFDTDCFTIVSVGRLDAVKQFEMIPDIIKKVIDNIPNALFKWYIIGDGDTDIDTIISSKVKDYNISSYLIRIPGKSNVFPYVKNADLFVHTSKSETFSRVVNEAKVLGVPVLINNYGCSTEFVKEGTDGWIVPIAQMDKKITQLLINQDDSLYHIKNHLSSWRYDNDIIMRQIVELLS